MVPVRQLQAQGEYTRNFSSEPLFVRSFCYSGSNIKCPRLENLVNFDFENLNLGKRSILAALVLDLFFMYELFSYASAFLLLSLLFHQWCTNYRWCRLYRIVATSRPYPLFRHSLGYHPHKRSRHIPSSLVLMMYSSRNLSLGR